ncbi:ABC transporter permease [Vreelandella nigrificans]|uniref:ABC transporter permease n=1 Tax=Vreelandella nigrificans TaxID=2042704 RepID=A0A2A4HLC3_9GAMM|nr:ABC transporter permease [Halomonas nigrificans]PCF95570.1 ABC transporter permease [Halomonas nigrificans]
MSAVKSEIALPRDDEGGHSELQANDYPWLKSSSLGVILPLALAIGWELVVYLGWAEGRLLPPPSRILATLWGLTAGGELALHIGATLWRVAMGFLIGAVAGIAIGAAVGYQPLLRRLLDPSVQALRAIPSLAWVPLFILWLGIFETSKVALIAVGVFFPVYLGVSAAVMTLDRKIVEVGKIFRLSGYRLVCRIFIPATLPSVILALRTGLGLGWMFVVAAELMGASQGLGYLLVDGQQMGRPDQILAAIIVFAVIGKLTDGLIVTLSAPFLRWQDNFAGGH